jgi:hypothetical protein
VTKKTGFGFDDRIYWTFIQLVTIFHKSLSSNGHSRLLITLHYATTPPLQLNTSTHLLVSESGFLYDWRFTANQLVLAKSPLRSTTTNFVFQLNTCGYNPYVTSSLTRRWVCCLQLLAVLSSAVILRSEFHGTHDHTLLSQILPEPGELGSRIYIPQEQDGPVITPGTGFPFRRHDSQGYDGGIRPHLHTYYPQILEPGSLSYIASGRTPQKTRPLPRNGRLLLSCMF